jgi:WD40 repeat protein
LLGRFTLGAQIWVTAYGACSVTIPGAHAGVVNCVVADCGGPAGGVVLSGGEDGMLRAWALVDGTPRGAVEAASGGGGVLCLAAARDGGRVYSGGGDGALRLWSAAALADGGAFAPGQRVEPGAGGVTHLALSRSDDALFSASASGTLQAWRASDLAPLRVLGAHPGRVVAMALSRDGSLLASACAAPGAAAVHLWRIRGEAMTAQDEPRILRAPVDDAPTALAVSSDGAAVFCGYASGAVRAVRGRDAACTHTLAPARAVAPAEAAAVGAEPAQPQAHDAPLPPVTCVALSRLDDRLAVGTADGGVRLARAGDLRPTHALWGHRHAVAAVAVSKDGRDVLAAGAEGVLRKWSVGPPLAFSRAACLTLDTRTPGCIPSNLTRVLASLATAAGEQITPARRAQATAAVNAAVSAASSAGRSAAAAVAAAYRERQGAGGEAAGGEEAPMATDSPSFGGMGADMNTDMAQPAQPEEQ